MDKYFQFIFRHHFKALPLDGGANKAQTFPARVQSTLVTSAYVRIGNGNGTMEG